MTGESVLRHVLFVDDEPSILSGLRRMLHSMRGRWRMTFVPSGGAALEVLESDPADVVVSDMRMPGMDGAELLAEVQRRWPGTVRMILSGFADEGAALRSVPVAHRFLNKPCDAADLARAVSSACELQDRLSRPELRTLVGGLGALPSVPTTFAAMTEALGRPDACADTVVPIIEQDTACSAKLLQLVNSAFFGLARSVTSIQDTVAYLGLIQVRNIVLTTGVTDLFRSRSPQVTRAVLQINRHSLAVAAAARATAPPGLIHDAFIAGMLHDVGELVLATVMPDRFLPIRESSPDDATQVSSELEILGATHADIGAYLLRLWGLPFPLVDAVARHHDADADHHPDPLVAVIAAAERLGGTRPPAQREVRHG